MTEDPPKTTTLSTSAWSGPLPEGTFLFVETAGGREIVKVGGGTGSGPFTARVERVPMSWWAWKRMALRSARRRSIQWATRPVREFWWSRCEKPWCWRPETGRGYCWKHAHLEND